jgi:hypothetical protein
VVILVIVALTALILLVAVPRGREQARLAACARNLAQIGVALTLYDQMLQKLPVVAELAGLDEPATKSPASPLRMLLDTLQLPDLTKLDESKPPPQPRPGEIPGEMPVPGFVCASDPGATALQFTAPISYRATTGADASGTDGAFAPGRVLSLPEIEAGDGRGYTAGFSERLVGDNRTNHVALSNYRIVTGPLAGAYCPDAADSSAWRGDAGSSWTSANYRSTLYNHSLPPGGSPSCVASEGNSAFMGSSSGHVRGVNLLRLDGSVSIVRPTVDRKVWQELATVGAADSPQ